MSRVIDGRDLFQFIMKKENSDYETLMEGAEADLSDIVVRKIKNNMKAITKKGPLYSWNPTTMLWECQEIDYLYSSVIRNILEPLYQEAIEEKETEIDIESGIQEKEMKEKIKAELKALKKRFTKIKQRVTLGHLQDLVIQGIRDPKFLHLLNSKNNLLPVREGNGIKHIVVDLKTKSIRARTKEDYFTYELDVEYKKASCPLWDKFISQITCHDPKQCEDLQRIWGYCISGEVKEKLAFFFVGTGNNSKSTLVNIFIKLFEHEDNDFISSINPDIISQNFKRSNAPTPELYKVKNARIAIVNEFGHTNINEDLFKTLTSGGLDPIEARPLYREPVTFVPRFKLIILMNNLPNLSDMKSVMNRVKIVDFKAEFTDDLSKCNPEKYIFPRDPYISENLLSSEESKSAILNWLIEGANKYYHEGLQLSDNVNKATMDFKNASDTVQSFIDNCCQIEKDSRVAGKPLYDAYKQYCLDNNMRPYSIQNFANRLINQLGFQKVKVRGIITYIGLSLGSILESKE
jgi:P4 family phage/plasmid primase-like protien